jgi:AhpD family alkylhydroperoxidase
MLANDDAWKRLPGAPEAVQPLPAWARLLAGPLPLTTARMLELDALHRSGARLDPKLRGVVRWAAADANGCDYAARVAIADLRRAGVNEAELASHAHAPGRLSAAEHAAMAFARQMMGAAHAVSDEEVQHLLRLFGEEQVVALVALLAHASFQDHLFLAARVRIDPGAPLPPLAISFAKPAAANAARGATVSAQPTPVMPDAAASAAWLGLQKRLDQQRGRVVRIRVPSPEEVLGRIGDHHPAAWQASILWSRVCYGFQPELTDAWFACTAAFRQEAQLDRVFEQCIFWVITRSLQCFY